MTNPKRKRGPELPSAEELFHLVERLLDGVDGYECETGYLRYWDPTAVARARELVDKFKPLTKGTVR